MIFIYLLTSRFLPHNIFTNLALIGTLLLAFSFNNDENDVASLKNEKEKQIWIDSEIGKGSTFHITMPIKFLSNFHYFWQSKYKIR